MPQRIGSMLSNLARFGITVHATTNQNAQFPHQARYPNNWNNGTPLASEFGVRERFIRWYAKHKPRPREINLSATKGGMGGNEI